MEMKSLVTRYVNDRVESLAGMPILCFDGRYLVSPSGIKTVTTVARISGDLAARNTNLGEWLKKFNPSYDYTQDITVAIVPLWYFKRFTLFPPCKKKEVVRSLAYHLAMSRLHISMSPEEMDSAVREFVSKLNGDDQIKYSSQIYAILEMFNISKNSENDPYMVTDLDLDMAAQFLAAISTDTKPCKIRDALEKSVRKTKKTMDREWKIHCKKSKKNARLGVHLQKEVFEMTEQIASETDEIADIDEADIDFQEADSTIDSEMGAEPADDMEDDADEDEVETDEDTRRAIEELDRIDRMIDGESAVEHASRKKKGSKKSKKRKK